MERVDGFEPTLFLVGSQMPFRLGDTRESLVCSVRMAIRADNITFRDFFFQLRHTSHSIDNINLRPANMVELHHPIWVFDSTVFTGTRFRLPNVIVKFSSLDFRATDVNALVVRIVLLMIESPAILALVLPPNS